MEQQAGSGILPNYSNTLNFRNWIRHLAPKIKFRRSLIRICSSTNTYLQLHFVNIAQISCATRILEIHDYISSPHSNHVFRISLPWARPETVRKWNPGPSSSRCLQWSRWPWADQTVDAVADRSQKESLKVPLLYNLRIITDSHTRNLSWRSTKLMRNSNNSCAKLELPGRRNIEKLRVRTGTISQLLRRKEPGRDTSKSRQSQQRHTGIKLLLLLHFEELWKLEETAPTRSVQ